MRNLTLYHYWRSSCSWRVRWAMIYKNVPYESNTTNLLKGEHKKPDFLKMNPLGQVPCLIVNDQAFGESLAMIEWLEEVFPKPALLPQDSLSRLRVRELCQIIIADTQPLQNLSVQNRLTSDPHIRQEWVKHWIRRGLAAFETLITTTAGTYSFGGELTMADLCLVPQFYNALRNQVNVVEFPKCKKIYERCLARPDCKKAHPDQQPDAVK